MTAPHPKRIRQQRMKEGQQKPLRCGESDVLVRTPNVYIGEMTVWIGQSG